MNKKLEEIIAKIKNNNAEIYLVGGAIRDSFLNRENYDLDFCISNISEEKFLDIFPEAIKTGKDFNVFRIDDMEFALARREIKIGKGHKGFKAEFENIDIEEDLKRRDITINSIAKNMITGEIVDPYGGIADITNKIIRATSNKFLEDPLRAYRVARFAAQLDFYVEDNTIKLMKELKKELNLLPKERVFEEFRKALNSNNPQIFFEVLKKAEILDIHFKEIYDLIGALQPIEYHPEGDSYNHTIQVLKKVSDTTKKEEIRFAGLVHDLGKGITPKEEYPHHYNHDINGIELVKNLGKRIGAKNSWIKCGIIASKEHMRAGMFNNMTINKKVSFIENMSKTALGLEGMQIIVTADNKNKVNFLEIGNEILNHINGKYIMNKYNIREGKKIKEKLHIERIEYLRNKIYNNNTRRNTNEK